MFLNSWSLTLCLCSLLVIILIALASRTACQVLLYWDQTSDSERQIRLENEIWLASTLVSYALWFQIISLILFVSAADHYCKIIVGAMCATGALLANSYGMPALLIKLVGVFLYGFWIILHKLDISSEKYPLVRIKCFYLIILLPLLLADAALQILYIIGLKPDIITSCCAVIFETVAGSGQNPFNNMPHEALLAIFYGTAIMLAVLGIVCYRKHHIKLVRIYAIAWLCFLILAVITIINVLSSYIYAMPFHNCPFCLLKPEYHYIGFAIYAALLSGSFFGITPAVFTFFNSDNGVNSTLKQWQHQWVMLSLLLLFIFTSISSTHYFLYLISGGEN